MAKSTTHTNKARGVALEPNHNKSNRQNLQRLEKKATTFLHPRRIAAEEMESLVSKTNKGKKKVRKKMQRTGNAACSNASVL